jgi:Bacterial PH domain
MSRAESYGLLAVDRYLLPREERVATVRQHQAMLISPLAAAIGGILAATTVTVTSTGSVPLKIAAWILAGSLVARFTMILLVWFVRYISITNERVVLTSGLLSRRVKTIPLPNFAEMTFERSFGGRMIGYGTFTIEASGKAYLIINYIPYSEQIQLVLSGRIYRGISDDDSDSDSYDEDSYSYEQDDEYAGSATEGEPLGAGEPGDTGRTPPAKPGSGNGADQDRSDAGDPASPDRPSAETPSGDDSLGEQGADEPEAGPSPEATQTHSWPAANSPGRPAPRSPAPHDSQPGPDAAR